MDFLHQDSYRRHHLCHLHQHLRAACFIRMYRARCPVDSFSLGYQLLGQLIIDRPRVAQLRSDLFVPGKFCQIRLVRDNDQYLLAAAFTSFRSDECLYTRSRFFKFAIIAILVLRICQFVRCAYRITQYLFSTMSVRNILSVVFLMIESV